jgi:hypothetical protein
MGMNGVAVIVALKQRFPTMVVTETHPKVIHWHLCERRYDYLSNSKEMCETIAQVIGCAVDTQSEHEWDAALSAEIARRALASSGYRDLHQLPTAPNERLVWPCGESHFFWPIEALTAR